MKNILIVLIALGLIVTMCGCFSMMAYKSNEKQVYGKYAYRSGDPQAIKAYTDGKYVQMGVDVTAADIIFDSWGTFGKQVLGAAADAGTGYLCYLGVKELTESNGDDNEDDSANQSGNDTYDVDQDGQGNTIIINQDNSSDTGVTE